MKIFYSLCVIFKQLLGKFFLWNNVVNEQIVAHGHLQYPRSCLCGLSIYSPFVEPQVRETVEVKRSTKVWKQNLRQNYLTDSDPFGKQVNNRSDQNESYFCSPFVLCVLTITK